MKASFALLIILLIVVSCEDSGPAPITPDPIIPDTILTVPYEDIIGIYQGPEICESGHLDLPTHTWTINHDTTSISFEIKGVIDNGNDHLRLDTEWNSLFYFGGTKELFSKDTIEFFAYWSYTQRWLTLFRKQHKIEIKTHSGNPGGTPDYTDCFFTGIKG